MNEHDAYRLVPLRKKISVLTEKLRLARIERDDSSSHFGYDSSTEETYYNAMNMLDKSNYYLELCLFSLHYQIARSLGISSVDYIMTYLPPPFDICYSEDLRLDISEVEVGDLLDRIEEDQEEIQRRLLIFLKSYFSSEEPSDDATSIEDALLQTSSEFETSRIGDELIAHYDWLPAPQSLQFRLEAALEPNGASDGYFEIIDYGQFKVVTLGRYFPKRIDRHFSAEGLLSKCILQAKDSGYPDEITQGLACTIMQLAAGTIVTTVPDRDTGKYKRMHSLIHQLKVLDELQHLSFSSTILEFARESISIRRLSYENRVSHLHNSLHTSSSNIDISGCSILVIDDVVTTGATFSRAYELLKGSGAQNVYFIAMAKTARAHK